MTNTVFEMSLLWDYAKVDSDVSMSVNEVLLCPTLKYRARQGKIVSDPVWCLQKSLFNSTGCGAGGWLYNEVGIILSCIGVHIL